MQNSSLKKAVMQRMEGCASFSTVYKDQRSSLEQLYQSGSLKLRFPLYSDNHFEAVQINTAGGVTGGDKLFWKCELGEKTKATITTQAAEKIYRSLDGLPAAIDVSLTLRKNSTLFWLPQETIFFNRGALKRKITVEMEEGAALLLVEAFVFGRKLMGEKVVNGFIDDEWQVRFCDELVHFEAFKINGNILQQSTRPAIFNANQAIATILYIADDYQRHEAAAREIIGQSGGVSAWNGKFLARMIEKDSYSLREKLVPLVKLLTKGADVPKFWSI